MENLEGSFYGEGINWPAFDRQVTSPSATQHEAFHLFHVDVCVSVCVFCVCLSGVYGVSGGQLSGCWGRDPSVKWSSGPRWVSNSHNPTGHRGGSAFAAAPHKPRFLLSLLPPLALLSTPLCLSNPPPRRLPPSPVSPCLPVSPEKQQEANEAWLAFIQLSIPLCVYVCVCMCVRVVSPGPDLL